MAVIIELDKPIQNEDKSWKLSFDIKNNNYNCYNSVPFLSSDNKGRNENILNSLIEGLISPNKTILITKKEIKPFNNGYRVVLDTEDYYCSDDLLKPEYQETYPEKPKIERDEISLPPVPVEFKSVEFFQKASNSDLRKLDEELGFINGCSGRITIIRKILADKYQYENYRDIPTKLLTLEEFCNAEISPKTPFNPYGYCFETALSDYNEMITW